MFVELVSQLLQGSRPSGPDRAERDSDRAGDLGVGAGTVGEQRLMQDDPDFPWPQQLRGDRAEGRVTISCQVTYIDFVWQLVEDGPGTRIDVHVALPDSQAHQLDGEREIITTSLAQLATLAQAAATN